MSTARITVPRLPAQLGYAGLLPFVTLSVAIWLAPATYQILINQALLLYASLILTFIGAVHWGLAMFQTQGDYRAQLGFSVVPALVAWIALFLPEIINYSVLIIAFALLCLFDARMSKLGRAPTWYPQLRSPLTAVVVACLIVAQLQFLPFH